MFIIKVNFRIILFQSKKNHTSTDVILLHKIFPVSFILIIIQGQNPWLGSVSHKLYIHNIDMYYMLIYVCVHSTYTHTQKETPKVKFTIIVPSLLRHLWSLETSAFPRGCFHGDLQSISLRCYRKCTGKF